MLLTRDWLANEPFFFMAEWRSRSHARFGRTSSSDIADFGGRRPLPRCKFVRKTVRRLQVSKCRPLPSPRRIQSAAHNISSWGVVSPSVSSERRALHSSRRSLLVQFLRVNSGLTSRNMSDIGILVPQRGLEVTCSTAQDLCLGFPIRSPSP